jgi:hypothetical protein
MKRVQYHRYAGPEVLRLEEFALAARGAVKSAFESGRRLI